MTDELRRRVAMRVAQELANANKWLRQLHETTNKAKAVIRYDGEVRTLYKSTDEAGACIGLTGETIRKHITQGTPIDGYKFKWAEDDAIKSITKSTTK
jgi:hypothetical protein